MPATSGTGLNALSSTEHGSTVSDRPRLRGPALIASLAANTAGAARSAAAGRWPGRTVTAKDLSTGTRFNVVTGLFAKPPYEEGFLEANGLKLHYEIHGDGSRVLLFLHGILLDGQMNRRLAGDLAKLGYRVVLLDLPGHGKSDKPTDASEHRMDLYARHVACALDELGIEEAVVGGVSLGANVALQFAVRYPERTKGLIAEMPVLELATPGVAVAFVPWLLGVHYASPLFAALSAMARRVPSTRIGPLDSLISALALHPSQVAAVLDGLLVGPLAPTAEERRAVRCPALVIGHKVDIIHPYSDATQLAGQLKNARLVQAKSVIELRVTPERLTSDIALFLDRTWSSAQRKFRRPLANAVSNTKGSAS